MGKYMKKAKPSGEVAAMESCAAADATTAVGVRTRARTLALLQTKQPQEHSFSELRRRRLEKSPSTPKSNPTSASPNPRIRNDKSKKKDVGGENEGEAMVSFFGENVIDAESTHRRSYRETTPCSSMIRDPETMGTPGSTTSSPVAACHQRRQKSSMIHREYIPTSHDIEEFFVGAERLHQRSFSEKYNFDPVNDCPLPGRYEWLILD